MRCWPEFFTEYGCAACGAIALMNEDGRPGGCEADVFGVISSLVLQSASGQGVFNTDLVDVDPVSDTVVFWHCGQAPIEMADPEVAPRATIHSNRKLPLLSEFPLKPGRITLCRITQGEGKLRMMLSGGEMIRAPLAFSGTSGVARLDVARRPLPLAPARRGHGAPLVARLRRIPAGAAPGGGPARAGAARAHAERRAHAVARAGRPARAPFAYGMRVVLHAPVADRPAP
ncbi:MAG: hypothetical protein MZV49_08970 [Rhodopseudomonas palustris]|nr:hypothetical protein [Rhodopseudomonas palustris]